MIDIDRDSEFGARVARHLEQDLIGWIVTTDPDGTPQPSPIWFLWDGETLLIHSQRHAPKLRNIANNPRVALHFDGDRQGGDIVILTGTARILGDAPPSAETKAAYEAKYADGMRRIGMTTEQFAAAYPIGIRMTPEALRGH